MTTYVIFDDKRQFPSFPVYEGPDEVLAARALLKGAEAGKTTAIRVRDNKALRFGTPEEVRPLIAAIKRLKDIP